MLSGNIADITIGKQIVSQNLYSLLHSTSIDAYAHLITIALFSTAIRSFIFNSLK